MKKNKPLTSIARTISHAFIIGAIALLLINWFLFRSVILLTENQVNTQRLEIVSEHYFSYYLSGNTGAKVINPLMTSYDNYSQLPNKIKEKTSRHWLGSKSEHFDGDDSEYAVLAKNLNGNTYYLVENIGQAEWNDHTFLIIELSELASSLFILLLAGFLIQRVSNKIAQPFQSLAQELAKDDGKTFHPINVAGQKTLELQQTLTAINQYRNTLDASLKREQSFTRYVSHELRTPMTVIKGALSLLKRQENTQVDKQCQRIDRAVNNMNALTQTFLLLARESDTNEQEIVIDTKLITQEIEDIQSLVEANHCSIDYQLLTEFTLKADGTLFKALFKNLLINAVNSTANGHVSIFIESTQLTIIDNGIGLEAESRGYQGFGIGLVIVQDICQKYGWQFSLTNNETQGCSANVIFTPAITN